jgi:regulator of sirC expression with transglutaminase-like and TPR domain
MSDATRTRLARLVREPDADLAEAALLICAEAEPELDVAAELLRIDALADGLASTTLAAGIDDARRTAVALGSYVGGTLGFVGDDEDYHDPANGLLTRVLDRRRGLPITLSILYVAIGRRLRLPVFPIGLPGHVVTGVGGDDRPVVVDPFHGGRLVDEPALAELVRVGSRGTLEYHRAMLRPTPVTAVVRRVLDNLTRDFVDRGDLEEALWTIELKRLLPAAPASDHRVLGELLYHLGRYRVAAESFETYVEEAETDAPDLLDVSHQAIRARAKLN